MQCILHLKRRLEMQSTMSSWHKASPPRACDLSYRDLPFCSLVCIRQILVQRILMRSTSSCRLFLTSINKTPKFYDSSKPTLFGSSQALTLMDTRLSWRAETSMLGSPLLRIGKLLVRVQEQQMESRSRIIMISSGAKQFLMMRLHVCSSTEEPSLLLNLRPKQSSISSPRSLT